MSNNAIKTTKKYFELSNQGDLTAIKALIHPKAIYSSINTGMYFGIDDIMTMMNNFFAQYSDLEWQIDDLKANSANITEVAFTGRFIDHQGSIIKRTGTELLVVDNGLIRLIEVR